MDSFSNMCPPQIGHKSPFLPSLSRRRHYASHISLLFGHLLGGVWDKILKRDNDPVISMRTVWTKGFQLH